MKWTARQPGVGRHRDPQQECPVSFEFITVLAHDPKLPGRLLKLTVRFPRRLRGREGGTVPGSGDVSTEIKTQSHQGQEVGAEPLPLRPEPGPLAAQDTLCRREDPPTCGHSASRPSGHVSGLGPLWTMVPQRRGFLFARASVSSAAFNGKYIVFVE